MKQLLQISDSELVLMRLIWERGGGAVYAEIMEALEKQGIDWKKNTVLTFLSRLVEKQYLSTSKIGRRNEYRALVSERDYHTAQTKLFVDRVYEGSVEGLISTLLQQGMVPDEEKEALREYWNGGDGNE